MIKPMTTQRPNLHISAYIQEIDQVPLEKEIVKQQVDLIFTNPFGALKEMDIERKNKWSITDYPKVIEALNSKEDTSVVLRSLTPFGMSCSLAKNKYYNTLNLNLVQAAFDTHAYEELFDFMYRSAKIFKHFKTGTATADTFEISDFYLHNNLPFLPDIFGGMLPWFTLLAPHTYQPYYTKEILLAAPVYKIYTYENDWIGIRAYENPFDFTALTTGEKIAAVNTYLNASKLKP
jgi:hypothetical protein